MKKCLNCLKEINEEQKYCSNKCVIEYRRNVHPNRKGQYFNCVICNKKIYRQKSLINKNRKYYFCSRECFYKAIKQDKKYCGNTGKIKYKIIDATCKYCGKVYKIKKYNSNINIPNKYYCSKQCRFKHIREDPTQHPNYKGGKYIKCIYCGKRFWKYNDRKNQKYCSVDCYLNDPLSPNRQFGEDNPMMNLEYRKRAINGRIKYLNKIKIREGKKPFWVSIGKNETKILDDVENQNNIKIKRQYKIGGYRVDGYCEETNTVYQVYEKWHKYFINKDSKIKNYIKKKLQCKYIEIRDGW